jgi:hypothetical protein
MLNKIKTLFEINVVSSTIGNLFVFNFGEGQNRSAVASNELASDDVISGCQLVILDNAGNEKHYFIVGNHYDQDTKFSPHKGNWFAEGAIGYLRADDFTEGTVIKVEFKRPEHLSDHELFQAKMAVWVVLTHRAGSAGFLNVKRVLELIRYRPKVP